MSFIAPASTKNSELPTWKLHYSHFLTLKYLSCYKQGIQSLVQRQEMLLLLMMSVLYCQKDSFVRDLYYLTPQNSMPCWTFPHWKGMTCTLTNASPNLQRQFWKTNFRFSYTVQLLRGLIFLSLINGPSLAVETKYLQFKALTAGTKDFKLCSRLGPKTVHSKYYKCTTVITFVQTKLRGRSRRIHRYKVCYCASGEKKI